MNLKCNKMLLKNAKDKIYKIIENKLFPKFKMN